MHNKVSSVGYPDNAVRVSGDDDVLRVPLVHLRHAAAQDLLTAPCEGVGAGDGAAVNAPHVNVCARTGHNIPLHKHKHTHTHRYTLCLSSHLLNSFYES